jgi:hypothetical protein
MTRTLALVAAILALAACEQPSAPSLQSRRLAVPVALNDAGDVTRENLKIELADVTDSPCTGEPIQFDGLLHVVTTTEQTSDGVMLKAHSNTQGVSGVGLLTGAKYEVIQVMNETETAVLVPLTGSADVAIHFRIISQGSLDNFLADIVYTFTLPDLIPTYKINNVRCEG